jgi:hypothetical protein
MGDLLNKFFGLLLDNLDTVFVWVFNGAFSSMFFSLQLDILDTGVIHNLHSTASGPIFCGGLLALLWPNLGMCRLWVRGEWRELVCAQ